MPWTGHRRENRKPSSQLLLPLQALPFFGDGFTTADLPESFLTDVIKLFNVVKTVPAGAHELAGTSHVVPLFG